MWTIFFSSLIEFHTMLLLFYVFLVLKACGSLVPEQGLNPCPLHWKAKSQPLDHQGSPKHLSEVTCSVPWIASSFGLLYIPQRKKKLAFK